MSKGDAIVRYKTAMSIFKNWLATGMISDTDLLEINTILAQKYGLSTCYHRKIATPNQSQAVGGLL